MLYKNSDKGKVNYGDLGIKNTAVKEVENKVPIYICDNCGKALDTKVNYCPLCGHKINKK